MWARLCRPDAVQARDRLAIIHCDVLDAAAAVAAMNGGDAVICTVGPANNRKPGTLISVGTRNLVAGCTASGITRFVFESGLMVGDGRDLSMSGRFAVRLAGWVYSGLKSDKVLAVAAITAGPLDWVIVRPPNLIRAAATGLLHCRTFGADFPPQSDPARRLRCGTPERGQQVSMDSAGRQCGAALTLNGNAVETLVNTDGQISKPFGLLIVSVPQGSVKTLSRVDREPARGWWPQLAIVSSTYRKVFSSLSISDHRPRIRP